MRCRLTRINDGIETHWTGEVRADGVYFWSAEPDQCIHEVSGPHTYEAICEMFDSIA